MRRRRNREKNSQIEANNNETFSSLDLILDTSAKRNLALE